jgi:hypothetical protein
LAAYFGQSVFFVVVRSITGGSRQLAAVLLPLQYSPFNTAWDAAL